MDTINNIYTKVHSRPIITMKKSKVLELALQLDFLFAITSCNSKNLYASNVIKQVTSIALHMS